MAQPAAQPAEAPPQPFVSPPQPSSAGVQQPGGATWEDAAPLLARACEAMAPGELVQADSFSLFESVSAVEIGEHAGDRKSSSILLSRCERMMTRPPYDTGLVSLLTQLGCTPSGSLYVDFCIKRFLTTVMVPQATHGWMRAPTPAAAPPRRWWRTAPRRASCRTRRCPTDPRPSLRAAQSSTECCVKGTLSELQRHAFSAQILAMERQPALEAALCAVLHGRMFNSLLFLPQILAVMDRLAALEAAWHAGHFLPQSGYTCLYMLLPDRWGA